MRGSLSPGRCCPLPPSGISGRRASSCCALSGFFDSLSSAGRVCWAKPNHGFFRCQHFGGIIFALRPRRSQGLHAFGAPIESAMHARAAGARATTLYETAFFQRFFNARIDGVTQRDAPANFRRVMRARPTAAGGDLKIISAKGWISASHKPICADLRKRSATAADAAAGSTHVQQARKNPRRRHRGFGSRNVRSV